MTIFYIVISVVLVSSFLANWHLDRRVASLKRQVEFSTSNGKAMNDCAKCWMARVDEARAKTRDARAESRQLQRRVEQLEPALAECVAALRRIGAVMGCGSYAGIRAMHRRKIAQETLDRIQIPDDELPTEGYASDAP